MDARVARRRRLAMGASVGLSVLLLSGMLALAPLVAPPTPSVAVAAMLAAGAVLYLALSVDRRQPVLATAGLLAALVSVATTVLALIQPLHGDVNTGWGLLEVIGLLGLVMLLTQHAARAFVWAVAALLVTAQMAWIVRFLPEHNATAVLGAMAGWGIGSAAAVAAGVVQRSETRWHHAGVAAAQARQRRDLERDLHDYVAHDLSAMVAQAQAARYTAGDEPDALRAALLRIEEAGQKALTSMDKALELLRDGPEPASPSALADRPTLEQMTDVLEAFGRTTGITVEPSIEGSIEDIPRPVSATMFRVLVECLTNVMRHASSASRLDVTIRVLPTLAEMRVVNDGVTAAGPTRRVRGSRGGTGLAFLETRVTALGGDMAAVRARDTWTVEVRLPLTGRAGSS